jgi:hypothetical protein
LIPPQVNKQIKKYEMEGDEYDEGDGKYRSDYRCYKLGVPHSVLLNYGLIVNAAGVSSF